jgi:hypothetical protein
VKGPCLGLFIRANEVDGIGLNVERDPLGDWALQKALDAFDDSLSPVDSDFDAFRQCHGLLSDARHD